MAGPAPEFQEGFGHVVIDDVQDALKPETPVTPEPTATSQDLFNQRLDLDSLPEGVRGKSVNEIVQRQIALEQALRISEQARESMAQMAQRPQQAPQQQYQPEPELTREQLQELMQNDPLTAIDYVINRRGQELVQHVERRFAPLTAGAASSAENYARSKYAKEYELFGDQISTFARSLPDPSILANPKGWDDMISYIRGLPGNIDKYVEAQIAAKTGAAAEAARQNQAANAGFSISSSQRPASGAPAGSFTDPVKAEIAKTMGLSYDEYTKWEKMG